jgi:hypothetical protein
MITIAPLRSDRQDQEPFDQDFTDSTKETLQNGDYLPIS